MTQNPMVEQVNRLIGNRLAGDGALHLPEVGSLYTERRRARRISRHEVVPPCRIVDFSSQERGISLVELIATVLRNAKPDAAAEQIDAQAQDIYGRWLGRVREGDTLTIEGIGVLKHKTFTMDDQFDKRLNPQGHAPVRITSKGGLDWVMALGITAAVAVCGAVGWWYFTTHPLTPAVEKSAAGGQVTATTAEAATETTSETALSETAPGQTAQTAQTAETAAQPTSQATAQQAQPAAEEPAQRGVMTMTSGHCYVVLGVFSTQENAARAAAEANEKDGALRCGIYRFGSKFMVSPFESDDREACTLFIRAHSAAFPDMWSYTAK